MARDILKTLKNEHNVLRDLFLQMEDTTDRAAKGRGELLAKIEANLMPHAKWEEVTFYPAFKERADRDGLKTLAEAGITAAPRVEANAITVLVAHVLTGAFATILPLGAAELFLAHGPLRAVPLTDPDARHEVGLVVPARDPHLPVTAALIAEAERLAR